MIRSALCLAMFLLCFTGSLRAEDQHEAMLVKMLASFKELGDLMAEAKDVESAKATEPKLLEAVKKYKALEAEMKKMPDPSKEVEEALKKKFEADMNATTGKMGKESERISKVPEIAKELEGSMKLLSGQ